MVGWSSPDFQDFLQRNDVDHKIKQQMVGYVEHLALGRIFIDPKAKGETGIHIENLHVSQCFSCKQYAVWRHDVLIHPEVRIMIRANADMPDSVVRDFDEAASIFDKSPRASAALLRLCVQKLCKHLGQPGENINADIAALVREGLSPKLQKALDTVRVTGNEVVHPGVIDLEDDRELAASLFTMVNLIVEEMISRPKHVDEMYAKLPQSKRDAIEARDRTKGK